MEESVSIDIEVTHNWTAISISAKKKKGIQKLESLEGFHFEKWQRIVEGLPKDGNLGKSMESEARFR